MSTSRRPKPVGADGYHHGNLRPALVDAGLALLEESDTADFSLREAARRAGVTVNASYRHFANKDALMAAIAAEGFRRFATALAVGARDGSTPRERMLGAGHAYVDFARAHPALFRLMFGRFSAAQKGEEISRAGATAYHVLKAGVGALLGEPDLASKRVEQGALRAWSLTHGLCYLILDGQIDDRQAGFRQLVDDVLGSYQP